MKKKNLKKTTGLVAIALMGSLLLSACGPKDIQVPFFDPVTEPAKEQDVQQEAEEPATQIVEEETESEAFYLYDSQTQTISHVNESGETDEIYSLDEVMPKEDTGSYVFSIIGDYLYYQLYTVDAEYNSVYKYKRVNIKDKTVEVLFDDRTYGTVTYGDDFLLLVSTNYDEEPNIAQVRYFEIANDGTVSEKENPYAAFYETVSENKYGIPSIATNGYTPMSPATNEEVLVYQTDENNNETFFFLDTQGNVIDEPSLLHGNQDTEYNWLNNPNIIGVNGKAVVYSVENVDGIVYYIYDREGRASKELSREISTFLSMTEDTLLYRTPEHVSEGRDIQHIFAYDFETNSINEVGAFEKTPGGRVTPGYEVYKNGGEAYFTTDSSEGVRWNKITRNNGKYAVVPVGDVFYEYDFGALGETSFVSKDTMCPFCGKKAYEYYSETFVLNDSVPNADKINAFFANEVETGREDSATYAGDISQEDCEWMHADDMNLEFFDEYTLQTAKMLSNNYLYIEYSGYGYWGGAHGYPYQEYYLFDTRTGERVTIMDLYQGSQEDFANIVADYTAADYDSYEYSPYFAESAETVREQAYEEAMYEYFSYNISYMEDCICVNYPPYEMGPYVSGFICVEIPYSVLGVSLD